MKKNEISFEGCIRESGMYPGSACLDSRCFIDSATLSKRGKIIKELGLKEGDKVEITISVKGRS